MADIKRVPPAEAQRLMDAGYVYLDVRTEQEYAAGHPKGAHNLPLLHAAKSGMAPNPDFLAVAEALYPKDSRLLVGCRSGQRSLRAATLLVAAGYTDVIDQRAGFEGVRDPFGQLTDPGWSAAGLPSESETPGGTYAERRKLAGIG